MITAVSRVFQEPFNLNDRQEAFNLGAQSIGRSLIAECQRVAPKLYMLMVNERTNADLLALEPLPPEEDPDSDRSTPG